MIRQRFYGVIIVLICLVAVLLAAQGSAPEEKDITAVFLLLPLGFYMIFGKQNVLHNNHRKNGGVSHG